MQASVPGCKTSISPLTMSDQSDSRKRTRASLPANGIRGRSVTGFADYALFNLMNVNYKDFKVLSDALL